MTHHDIDSVSHVVATCARLCCLVRDHIAEWNSKQNEVTVEEDGRSYTFTPHYTHLYPPEIAGPNRYHGAMRSGYAIRFYYGGPEALITPLGVVRIWNGSASSRGDVSSCFASLLDRLGAGPLEYRDGDVTPVFPLRSIDGDPLPVPEFRVRGDSPIPDVADLWRAAVEESPHRDLFHRPATKEPRP
jgi:hypothetical protein